MLIKANSTPFGDFHIPENFDAAFFVEAESGFDARAGAADVSPVLDVLPAF
jgi:hypothetical protein